MYRLHLESLSFILCSKDMVIDRLHLHSVTTTSSNLWTRHLTWFYIALTNYSLEHYADLAFARKYAKDMHPASDDHQSYRLLTDRFC
jgi:hypothetical protein